MKLSGVLAVCFLILYFSTGLLAAKKYCSHPDKVCHLPKDPGPCRGAFKRFYFDKELQQCRQFIYGGCKGNKNNFRTYKECEQTCPITFPTCLLPKVTGPCKAYFQRYYFNSCTGKCERFVYGGCHGNENNFKSITTCYKTCPCNQFNTIPPVNLNPTCYLPKERGPCKALIYRYFYNKCTNKCERFIYGGCLGNKNNFKSYKECDNVCHYPNVRG